MIRGRFGSLDKRETPAPGGIALGEMTDAERIEAYLINSGLAEQSLDAVRPDFPRWLDHLRERGVTHIPTAPWRAGPGDTPP